MGSVLGECEGGITMGVGVGGCCGASDRLPSRGLEFRGYPGGFARRRVFSLSWDLQWISKPIQSREEEKLPEGRDGGKT